MSLVTLTTFPPSSVLGILLCDETARNCAKRAVKLLFNLVQQASQSVDVRRRQASEATGTARVSVAQQGGDTACYVVMYFI